MKITMYELLGLVKDGKAPKRIRIRSASGVYDKEFYFDGNIYMYKDEYEEYAMTDDISIEMSLNDEVEILEEKKIPEKEDELIRYNIQEFDNLKEFVEITTNDVFGKINKIINNQNKIIDYLEYLKNKGDE